MDAYKEIIEKIVKNTSISREDIFDYEFSPFKKDFNVAFEFYYEALLRNSEYGISPCLLFYKNDFSINAAAGLHNGYYIVFIHMGTILGLLDRFRNKTDLLIGTENDEFIQFERDLDVPVHELMYQNTLHFTFYHEMAHLIQKSKLLENTLYEHSDEEGDFSINNHVLELDADKFSSLCIGAHVLKFLENNFGSELTYQQLEKTLILICSSALFYMLSFETNKKAIYYKQYTHPHPVIRISCIILNIVEYIRQTLARKGLKFDINTNDVLIKCIEFSNKLSIHKFESNLIENYRNILVDEAINIVNYIKEIRTLEEGDKSLASYKWNLKASGISTKKVRKKKRKKRTNKQIVERWKKRKRSKRTRIKRKKKRK